MCVLRVSGERFNVDRFLSSSQLEPYRVVRRGEPLRRSQPDGERNEVSGFDVKVSDGSWTDLREQVLDAITFLKQHRVELGRLRAARSVQDMRLDFPLNLRIDRKTVMAQYDYFPPALVSLAGTLGLGLEFSIYPPDLEELARKRKRARDRQARLAKKEEPKRKPRKLVR